MTEITFRDTVRVTGDPILPRWWRTIDKWMIGYILVLFFLGVIIGFSASVPLAQKKEIYEFAFVSKQLLFGIISLCMILFVSLMSPKWIKRLSVIFFVIGLGVLLFLPIIGVDHGKESVRWLSIAGYSVQPSEFIKPFFVITLAWIISASFDVRKVLGKTVSFVVMVMVIGPLLLQPDFGQTMLLACTWGVMFVVAGGSYFVIIVLVILLIIIGAVGYFNIPYIANRIDQFWAKGLEPNSQLAYANQAIQEGGMWGVGLTEGSVKWNIPDAHTDFIIAAAAEEFGFFVVLIVIGLFFAIMLRALLRLREETDMFIRIAGVGLVSMFSLQAFVNMGVSVRLLPPTGMTLPLISYGGSSLIATGITLGVLVCFLRERTVGERVRNTGFFA